MGIFQRVKAALQPKPVPAVVAKPGGEAIADLLNGKLEIDRRTKGVVDTIRRIMAADETPYAESYGGFKTQGEHAVAASSKDENLAMLQALIRWSRAGRVLEIGTAYGVSGAAIALAGARLTTIEGFEPQATLGPANLAAAGIEAECINARKEDAIPRLVSEGRRFDMVFHDGGHLGDAYVDDFNAIAPMLEPGAIFVIDNVFHDDKPARREFSKTLSRRTCREGWDELLCNPRVVGALVYRKTVGILLIK